MIPQNMKQFITHRIEELSVASLLGIVYIGPIISLLLSIYIVFFTNAWPLFILYCFWIYIDRDTCTKEGRPIKWFIELPLWDYFASYGPYKLIQTAVLPPKQNYILCTFPHGIVVTYAFAIYHGRNNMFSCFPGINVRGHTLQSNFHIPFYREFIAALGLRSVSKASLIYKLSKPTGGNAVFLVTGGSAESMKSYPGTHRVVLKNRKGFIKIALQTGASLVPMYAFGETDTYRPIFTKEKNPWIYKFQDFIRKTTGVALILFKGGHWFGLLPYRTPITVVVGKPITVMKKINPTSSEIESLHENFISELVSLFEQHKHKYVKNPEKTFLSVED